MVEIMLDLETMGTGPNAAIAQIGAVAFDVEKQIVLEKLQVYVDLESSVRQGGELDVSTILWWMRQEDSARAAFDSQVHCTRSIGEALCLFTELVLRHEPAEAEGVPVWGNGASFDNVILRQAYKHAGMVAPWHFWQDRCYRTIRGELPGHPKIEFEGIKHLAVADAMHQARQLMVMRSWFKTQSLQADPESEE